MKGIILSGGLGTRLHPLTKSVSKQLLPIFDKPMIYYSISTLIDLNIRDILIITNKEHLYSYKKLLNNFNEIGLNLNFEIQEKPNGIAEAFIIGKNFIGKSDISLILGDNIFFSEGLKKIRKKRLDKKARIFLMKVHNPNSYGVCKFKKDNLVSIIEKPKKYISDFAVTGLYTYKYDVVDKVMNLKYSKRGELEITDLNNQYIVNREMEHYKLDDNSVWFDAGSHASLLESSNFVQSYQNRTKLIFGSPEISALKNDLIKRKDLLKFVNKYQSSSYKDLLVNFLIN